MLLKELDPKKTDCAAINIWLLKEPGLFPQVHDLCRKDVECKTSLWAILTA